MIRINIIERGYIDLADGSMSFKRESGYFKFGKLVCGRSTEFSVPATDSNRTLFGFADELDERGDMMRHDYDAQMQLGTMVKDGVLRVVSCEGGSFKCAFYYDGYRELQAINGKKLADFDLSSIPDLVWSSASVLPADSPSLATMTTAIIQYYGTYNDNHFASWTYLPAVNVRRLAETCLTSVGVAHDLDAIKTNVWVVVPSLQAGAVESGTISKTDNMTAGVMPPALSPYLEWVDSTLYYGGKGFLPYKMRTACKFLRAKETIKVTFPIGMSNDIYISKVKHNSVFWNDEYEPIGGYYAQFFADRVKMVGTPLAGRTIDISSGTEFVVLDKTNAIVSSESMSWYTGYTQDASPYSINIGIARDEAMSYGDAWNAAVNMPDMTLVELLRSAALASSAELYYDDASKTLKVRDIDLSRPISLDDVISVDHVARVVDAWGANTRREVVDFDSEDYINERLSVSYDVPNMTLTDEVENTIKMCEGSRYDDGGVTYVYINDAEGSGASAKIAAKKPTLALSGVGKFMRRVSIDASTAYGNVAAGSTTATLKVMMSEEDFFGLGSGDYFTWRGMIYVWTSASWQGGVATLILQQY